MGGVSVPNVMEDDAPVMNSKSRSATTREEKKTTGAEVDEFQNKRADYLRDHFGNKDCPLISDFWKPVKANCQKVDYLNRSLRIGVCVLHSNTQKI